MYELWLAIHILCAVIWVGGGVSVHLLGRWTVKRGDPEQIVAFNRDAVKLGIVFYAPLSIVLIIAGVLLVEEVGYGYGDLWITLGFLGWLFSLALGVGFYPRQARKVEAAVTAGGQAAPEAHATIGRILLVNSIEITVLLLVIVDMAVKPGA
jgi:uncharacterized membrane protein